MLQENSKWLIAALVGAGGVALVTGCELIASVDHSLLDNQGGASTGGAGGSTGGTGGDTGGTGGVGGTPSDCTNNSECDDSNPCTEDVCGAEGSCTNTNVPDGFPPGYVDSDTDCVEDQCVGGVYTAMVADDTEVPDDMNDCTADSCSGGSPVNTNEPEGTDCGGAGLGLTCNDMGQCTGCNSPTDCGTDTECTTFTCDMNMVCGTTFTADGTPLTMQTAGDCSTATCDGMGGIGSAVNDTDLPVDGDPCTDDVCTGGVATNPNATDGTTCATGVCLTGACVDCIVPGDCTPPNNTCMNNMCSCVDAGACGGMACGVVTDACGQMQDCMLTNCGPMDVCDSNVCCTPTDPCGPTLCGGMQSDGCGGMVDCSATFTCPMGTPTCSGVTNMCE